MKKNKFKPCYMYRGGIASIGLINLCKWLNEQSYDIFNVADVGCYAGESAIIFYNNLRINAKIVCIDDYNIENFKDTGRQNLEKELNNAEVNFNERVRGLSRIFKIKGDISNNTIINKIPNNLFDIVFIDTTDNSTIFDNHLKCLLPKIKKDGYIAGSNFSKLNIKSDEVFENDIWVKKLII